MHMCHSLATHLDTGFMAICVQDHIKDVLAQDVATRCVYGPEKEAAPLQETVSVQCIQESIWMGRC